MRAAAGKVTQVLVHYFVGFKYPKPSRIFAQAICVTNTENTII